MCSGSPSRPPRSTCSAGAVSGSGWASAGTTSSTRRWAPTSAQRGQRDEYFDACRRRVLELRQRAGGGRAGDPASADVVRRMTTGSGRPDEWKREASMWEEAGAALLTVMTARRGLGHVDEHVDLAAPGRGGCSTRAGRAGVRDSSRTRCRRTSSTRRFMPIMTSIRRRHVPAGSASWSLSALLAALVGADHAGIARPGRPRRRRAPTVASASIELTAGAVVRVGAAMTGSGERSRPQPSAPGDRFRSAGPLRRVRRWGG